jgi:hypothetical protein
MVLKIYHGNPLLLEIPVDQHHVWQIVATLEIQVWNGGTEQIPIVHQIDSRLKADVKSSVKNTFHSVVIVAKEYGTIQSKSFLATSTVRQLTYVRAVSYL